MLKIISYLFIFFILINLSFSLDNPKLKIMYDLRKDFDPNDTLKGIDTLKKYTSGILTLNCDSLNCTAFYSSGSGIMVFKSVDGGYNWELKLDEGMFTTLGSPYPQAFAFPTPDFVLISFKGDTLKRTTDGGITWDTINTHLNSSLYYTNFLKNGIGIATGWDKTSNTNNILLRTTDYGATWSKLLAIPNIDEASAPKIFNDSTYGCEGHSYNPKNYYYAFSNNFGKTWSLYPFLNIIGNEEVYKPFFLDSLKGWILGTVQDSLKEFSEIIYKTIDGGKSWIKQLDTIIPYFFNLTYLNFIDSLNGITTGHFGTLIKTRDGGDSWIIDTTISSVLIPISSDAHFTYLSPRKYLILTDLGKIYMYNEDGFPNDVKNEPNYSNKTLVLYPNPVNSELNINLSENYSPPLSYQITDLQGRTQKFGFFKDGTDFNILKINTSGLKAGAYFINLIFPNGTESGKFVKE